MWSRESALGSRGAAEEDEDEDAQNSTLAYSFHAVDSTIFSVSASLLTLTGPSSMRAPSNEEQPGPPLSLRAPGRKGQRAVSTRGAQAVRDAPDDEPLALGDVLVAGEEEIELSIRGRRWGCRGEEAGEERELCAGGCECL